MEKSFKRWKWALILAAAILFILGLTAIVWPRGIMNILPILIGITLLAVGACELAFSFGTKEYKSANSIKLIQGVMSLAVGVVFLLKRDVSIVFLGVVLGLWAIISAALKISLALRQHAVGYPCRGTIVEAAVKGIIGLFMMFNPFVGLAAWTMVIGIFFIVAGGALFAWVIYVNRHLDFFDL
ncbi:MAG: DUF308 domain-containing protein [Oscillospiraceae bacterium]